MEGTGILKRSAAIMSLALGIGILSLGLSVLKNVVTERWLAQKNKVACVPADVEHSHPLVYHQTASNPIQSDAYLKTFVEEYIRLTQNEQIVNYHQLSQNKRYEKARLSQAKWQAIEMSTDMEKALNMQRYAESNEVFHELDKSNIGWVFLIDDILLFPAPNTGATMVVVRGEYQITYDKVKVDLPPRLWGYKEIQLLLIQAPPSLDSKDQYLNKYGVYVSWSNITDLTPDQKERYSKRSRDFYLMRQGE